jgi:hypothetical protein
MHVLYVGLGGVPGGTRREILSGSIKERKRQNDHVKVD